MNYQNYIAVYNKTNNMCFKIRKDEKSNNNILVCYFRNNPCKKYLTIKQPIYYFIRDDYNSDMLKTMEEIEI